MEQLIADHILLSKQLKRLDTIFKNWIGKVRLLLKQMGKKRFWEGSKNFSFEGIFQFWTKDGENLRNKAKNWNQCR